MPPHRLRDLSHFLTAQARQFYGSLPTGGRPYSISERYRVELVTDPGMLDLPYKAAVNQIPLPKRCIGTPRFRKEIAFALGGPQESVLLISTWNRDPSQTIGDILRMSKDLDSIDGLVILSRMFCARYSKRSPASVMGCHALHGIAFISGRSTFKPLIA